MALFAFVPSVAHIVLPHVLDEVDLLEALWSGGTRQGSTSEKGKNKEMHVVTCSHPAPPPHKSKNGSREQKLQSYLRKGAFSSISSSVSSEER